MQDDPPDEMYRSHEDPSSQGSDSQLGITVDKGLRKGHGAVEDTQDNSYPGYKAQGAYMASGIPNEQQAYLADGNYATTTRSSTSPPPVAHRRGYQACDACRKRKVRCDLGSVDNPQPPPCARCKRERRDCRFSETRRKRKSEHESSAEAEPEPKRRMTYSDSRQAGTLSPTTNQSQNWQQQWPSPQQVHDGQFKTEENGVYNYAGLPSEPPRPNEHNMMNQSMASVLHPSISTNHEALHLLSVAAGQSEQVNRQNPQSATNFKSPPSTFTSPSSQPFSNPLPPGHPNPISFSDQPTNGVAGDGAAENPQLKKALSAWSRMKFVRAGWISSHEAIAYLNYFFDHLAPLTPIVLPDYRNPDLHLKLLSEEPILAVALLSIASRHMLLNGSGSGSRHFFVHDRIYQFLSSMLQRLLWAQEQFGGGLTGGGKVRVHEHKPGTVVWKGGFRTLGTIEALMLLSDWHPRSLHFPPNEDDNRLLDLDYSKLDEEQSASEIDEPGPSSHSNYASYIEPAWRCDRMSWAILGLAQSLAFELGLFDFDKGDDGPDVEYEFSLLRKRRIRLLLCTHVAAHSGRMGIPSSLLPSQWEDATSSDKEATARGRARHNPVDAMQASWADLLRIMYDANHNVFLSKERRSLMVKSGEYIRIIEEFIPRIEAWKQRFDKLQVAEPLRTIIYLEAFSAQIYINGLALEAGVEQISRITSANGSNGQSAEGDPSGTGNARMEDLGKVQRHHGKYIRATAEAARQILQVCLDNLVPGNHLRHTPARSLFRITTALIYSYKCFIFGGAEQEIRLTFDLLGKCVDAMRSQAVDDVHIISQIAEFAAVLGTNVRSAMVRFNTAAVPSGNTSRAPSSEPHLANGRIDPRIQQLPTLESNPLGWPTDPALEGTDPLADISSQPIAGVFNQGSYMPPPNFDMFMNGMDNGDMANDQGIRNGFDEAWFALPVLPLINNSDINVSYAYGGLGPTIGNKDILDVVTDEHGGAQWPGNLTYTGANF